MISHKNNFGALRLFFASLVILSHSPELIDGNRSREILTNLFGTLSFGELAVDGFFLISGYLVTSSFYNSNSVTSYLIKRILRIYPGFIVASLISIFVFAPLSTGMGIFSKFSIFDLLAILYRTMLLSMPYAPGAFSSLKYPLLNGATWTILFEFLCYLFVPVLFYLGLGKGRKFFLILLLSVSLFIFNLKTNQMMFNPFYYNLIRFITAFLVGSTFYHFRDRIVFNKKALVSSIVLFLICFRYMAIAELAVFIFGSYILFYTALNYQNDFMSKIGTKTDISYGVYLYAWPFQNLTIQYHPTISPWLLAIITLFFAAMMGYLSWKFIEYPCVKLKGLLKK